MFVSGADVLTPFALVIHRGMIMATILNDLLETAFCFSLGVFNVQCSTQHEWLPLPNPILSNLLGKHLANLYVLMAVGWTKKVAKTKR